MLRARLAVAAAGLPLLALLVASPAPIFAAAAAALLAAAAFEMVRAADRAAPLAVPLAAAAATALLVAWMRLPPAFPVWTLLVLPAIALYGLLRPGPGPRRWREAWWLGAVVYAGVLGAHWALLRDGEDGRAWIVVLLGATFATDTAAYAVGRLLGSRPLAPRISPGKTVEGAAGGWAAGAAAALALPLALGLAEGPLPLAPIAVALPLAAQLGDLAESALKRRLGVKDASGLLPGHGGLLDRMDSLLFAGPCLYWMLQWP